MIPRPNRNFTDARLLVDVHMTTIPWAIKIQEDVIERGSAVTLEEIRALQIGRSIRTVLVDANFRAQEVEEAAYKFGWYTCRNFSDYGKAGLLEIAAATDQAAPPPAPPVLAAEFSRGFNSVANLAHSMNEEAGYWEHPGRDQEAFMRMVADVADATEAFQDGNPPDPEVPHFNAVETRLADVILRIMDLAPMHGWRIAEAILAKVASAERTGRMLGGVQV